MKQKRDSFGRMLAFGISSMVCLQAAINVAVATVSVPTKGLSLPLVSAGGSGLVITCAALGLLYSVCRFEHAEDAPVETLQRKSRPKHKRGMPYIVTENVWREWTVQG
jgi:cell division protein FtsW